MEKYYYLTPDKQQTGPFTLKELMEEKIDLRTYIWRSGLDKWTRAAEVPEVATLLAATIVPPVITENLNNNPYYSSGSAQTDNGVYTNPPIEQVKSTEENEASPATEEPAAENQFQGMDPPSPEAGYAEPPCSPDNVPPIESRPCPPTNLVWSILATVLCCLPLGIVAIYKSTRVSRHYNAGDYDKAVKASESATNWCIASITITALINFSYFGIFFFSFIFGMFSAFL